MSLKPMLQSPTTSSQEIGAYLDGLAHERRLAEVLALGRGAQRALWHRVADTETLTAEHFVPERRGELTTVRHHGRNTLPLTRRQQLFEKRFCRPGGESGGAGQRLFGYNESPFRPLIGPGCFVALPTQERAEWAERGSWVIDYAQVPDAPVVGDWPRVVPNSRGLQIFVYRPTRDFMRRVSAHVSIGAAYVGKVPIDSYFVLVREDEPATTAG